MHSFNVLGNSEVKDKLLSELGVKVPLGISGDLPALFRPRFEGLRGTEGDVGPGIAGEPGRLMKVSTVGGMGVLDGRGAWSRGRAGKAARGIGNAGEGIGKEGVGAGSGEAGG